jgi:lipopolysaccharide biosynthesis glycosyltransferase
VKDKEIIELLQKLILLLEGKVSVLTSQDQTILNALLSQSNKLVDQAMNVQILASTKVIK